MGSAAGGQTLGTGHYRGKKVTFVGVLGTKHHLGIYLPSVYDILWVIRSELRKEEE